MLQALSEMVDLFDEPLGDPTALPLFATVRAAAPEVRVLLSGEGADELFAGYPGYREPGLTARLARFANAPVGRDLAARLERAGMAGAGTLWRARTPVGLRYLGPGATFERSTREALYAARWPGPALPAETLARAAAADYPAADWLAAMRAVDRVVWLPDEALAKLDRITMGHGVEARVPYLEADVVALADRLPADVLVRGGVGKWALREVAARHVPRSLAYGPKHGFGVPLTYLMHGPWRAAARETVLGADSAVGGILDPTALAQTFAPVEPRLRPRRAREQYALWILELWVRSALSRTALAVPDVAAPVDRAVAREPVGATVDADD